MLKTVMLLLVCSITLYAVDCENAVTTIDMKECAYQEFQVEDKELNNVYKELIKQLDNEGKKKLKTVQRAWIVYRDAEAAFAADYARGGTISVLLYTGSQTYSTKKRVQELKSALKELENF